MNQFLKPSDLDCYLHFNENVGHCATWNTRNMVVRNLGCTFPGLCLSGNGTLCMAVPKSQKTRCQDGSMQAGQRIRTKTTHTYTTIIILFPLFIYTPSGLEKVKMSPMTFLLWRNGKSSTLQYSSEQKPFGMRCTHAEIIYTTNLPTVCSRSFMQYLILIVVLRKDAYRWLISILYIGMFA